MRFEEPRRFLIAVGVAKYKSAAWTPLDRVPLEIEKIVGVLTGETFRLQRILVDESRSPKRERLLEAVEVWSRAIDRRPDDHLILYWSGHGVVHGENLYLALPRTTNALANGLKLEDLVNILLGENSDVGPVLLLLDICNAGQGAIDVESRLGALTRTRPGSLLPSVAVICATGPRESAWQLVFADAFVKALESSVDRDKRLPPGLNLLDIAAKIGAYLKDSGQHPVIAISGPASQWAFFRNPHHVAHWPQEVDPATQRVLESLDVAARGVAAPEATGWFFRGRQQAFVDLCGWLKPDPSPGICHVTGGIGAGKSAVLGRLYTLSRADFRRKTPSHVLEQTEAPPVGSIDVAVVLSRMSRRGVVEAISRGLAVTAETEEQLLAELKNRKRCPVLLVDALEEADAPKDTLKLLERLATKMQVIVGVRKPYRYQLQPKIIIDLDVAPWADLDAVRGYVLERLCNGPQDRVTLFPCSQHDLERTADAVVERAQGNFLFASLIVTELLKRTANGQDGKRWEFPTTVQQSFDRIFDTLRDDESAIRDMLVPLAFADKGLPKGDLWLAIARRLGAEEARLLSIAQVFEKVPWFVVENLHRGRVVFRLFHAALVEYLQQGRDAAHVQSQIVEVLCEQLAKADSGHLSALDDDLYARRHLCRHMRRAGAWQDLGCRVISASWIARQCDRVPFASTDYAADVDESREAATVVNLRAASAGRRVQGLPEMVWWLMWRSAHVTLVEKIPPAAWSFLVLSGRMAPDLALRSVALAGNETLLSSRLVALARVFTGSDLDRLLDFAEDVGNKAVFSPKEPGAVDENILYERVLHTALFGADCERIASRALGAAARMKDHPRSLLIEMVLKHLDTRQLDIAHNLIEDMNQTGFVSSWWHTLAYGAYTAELARRGNDDAVRTAMNLPRDSLKWWLTAAALFAQSKSLGLADLAALSLTDELARAERSVDDWLYRLEIMTALICAIPNVATMPQRSALALYLRSLHSCWKVNVKVRLGAQAAECLPSPHRTRLLRWAKAALEKARGDDYENVNWFHTPPILAIAFSRDGDLSNALCVATHTEHDDFFRAMAFENVVRSFHCDDEAKREQATKVLYRFCSQLPPFEALQLLAASYAWTKAETHSSVVDSINGYHLKFSEAAHGARCAVYAALARYASSAGIKTLVRDFLRLSPSNAERERFARNCAGGSHADVAIEMLTSLEPHVRDWAWAGVLADASEPSIKRLVTWISKNDELFFEIISADLVRENFFRSVSRLPRNCLRVLEEKATGSASSLLALENTQLIRELAVRGFELGDEAFAMRQLRKCERSLPILVAARRLPLEERRQFIDLVDNTCSQSVRHDSHELYRAVAHVLSARASEIEVSALVVANMDGLPALTEPWFLDLLTPANRARVATAAFETRKSMLADQRQTEFEALFGWMLPWLGADAIDDLLNAIRQFDDDYYREQARVLILPHLAEKCGWQAAWEVCIGIVRYEFEAPARAALWPFLPDSEKDIAFAQLTPTEHSQYGREAVSLGKIAPLLNEHELVQASRWIIMNHGGAQAELLGPLIESARQRARNEGYAVWEAIVNEAARIPCVDGMSWLAISIPLAERLGGSAGLDRIGQFMARAVQQWP